MGKALSFLVASVDLGILGLLVTSRHTNTLSDLGLFGSFAITALLTWAVALCTALARVACKTGGWRAVRMLLIFFWLPALPPLIYGLSGLGDLRDLFARGKNGKSEGTPRLRVGSAPVALPNPTMTTERERDRVLA